MKTKFKNRGFALTVTVFGFIINSFYGIGNAVLGITTTSRWLITLSAYYIILSVMRFAVIFYELKSKQGSTDSNVFIKTFSGYMFLVLDAALVYTAYLTVAQDIGTRYHEIIMISIAAYTFTKVTFAAVNLYKSRRFNSLFLTIIRNISFADAAVSIFSLQRSMLVSFGSLSFAQIKTFNTMTGTAVCLIVAFLGINLIRKDGKEWQHQN